MRSFSHAAFAFLFAVPLFGCGSTEATASGGVPPDAATETSMPGPGDGGDAAALEDADAAQDATPPSEASVPAGPGVLLYAGYGPGPLEDTWTWDGSTWAQLPGSEPGVRSDQSMIGAGDGGVLLFGGQGLGPDLGDTWLWNGTAWSQLMTAGPSPREGAAVAELHGKIYLYGGEGSSGGFLSDTWEWDGAHWTQLTITGPTPGGRYGHSMATLGDVIVLFGNVAGPTDTWTFDGTSWKQAATVGPTGDPGGLSDSRGFQTMATLGSRVILFGGEQDANHILNDTWAWDGASWTQITIANPPPARFHAGMTTFQNHVVLFGGAGAPSSAPLLGDTWTFDGTTWTQAASSGPSPRYAYTLAVH